MAWFLRPDALQAFDDPEIKEVLSRYIDVSRGKRPAMFIVSRSLEVEDLKGEDGWREHDRAVNEALKIAKEGYFPEEKPKFSLLDLKYRLSLELASKCKLCERKCGVNRIKGEIGTCGVEKPRVATAFIHMGEEPPITPSGTIFFSGCNFKCVYCQNWDISQFPSRGEEVSERELALLMDKLREKGARNINLVGGEPTPNIPWIIGSLRFVTRNVPIVWNSNMYLSEESLKLLIGLVDVWLPDFKYWDDDHALRLSKVRNYREVITRNLSEIYRREGEILIRHLVLPGHLECCTYPILEWIAENTPKVLVNVMEQYRPEYIADKYEVNRPVSWEEVKLARKKAENLKLRWKSVS
jgi:putative pyruvate formate lyase activating enzyme